MILFQIVLCGHGYLFPLIYDPHWCSLVGIICACGSWHVDDAHAGLRLDFKMACVECVNEYDVTNFYSYFLIIKYEICTYIFGKDWTPFTGIVDSYILASEVVIYLLVVKDHVDCHWIIFVLFVLRSYLKLFFFLSILRSSLGTILLFRL